MENLHIFPSVYELKKCLVCIQEASQVIDKCHTEQHQCDLARRCSQLRGSFAVIHPQPRARHTGLLDLAAFFVARTKIEGFQFFLGIKRIFVVRRCTCQEDGI